MSDPFLTDFHIHVTARRGKDPAMTVSAVVGRARELDLAAVGLLEHLAPSRGRDAGAFVWIRDELAKTDVPDELRVFRGVEIDVMSDGTFEDPPDVRERFALDYVIGAVHGAPKGTPDDAVLEDNFRRMMTILEGPAPFEVLAHPWRSVLRCAAEAAGVEATFDLVPAPMKRELIHVCAAKDVAIEVNAGSPLDDPSHDAFLRDALAAGVKLALGSDAHFLNVVGASEKSAAAARRVGATSRDLWTPAEDDT